MAKKVSSTKKTKKPASTSKGSGKTTKGAKASAAEELALEELVAEGEPLGYRGELTQLAQLRGSFAALAPAESSLFLAQHSAEACRKNAESTKAADIFRAAMSWSRVFGENKGSPGLHPKRVRWFLDCTTALGNALAGGTTVENPSDEATYSDVLARTNKVLARSARKLAEAAGSSQPHKNALATARALPGPDQHAVVLRQVAALADAWLKEKKLNLALNDVEPGMVKSLVEGAKALEAATASRKAARQSQHDSPAVNELEGRLLFAMRPVWNDLREAREDGETSLVPPTSPALARGIGIRRRTKKTKGEELSPA